MILTPTTSQPRHHHLIRKNKNKIKTPVVSEKSKTAAHDLTTIRHVTSLPSNSNLSATKFSLYKHFSTASHYSRPLRPSVAPFIDGFHEAGFR